MGEIPAKTVRLDVRLDAVQEGVRNLVIPADQLKKSEAIFKALGSEKRIQILGTLAGRTLSVLEIAEALETPFTTITQHIKVLEKAGLIATDLLPSRRGLKKVCRRVYDGIEIHLPA